ncbi:MAG TPA: hypothetical protein DEP71_07345 [Porphyromonadaceae bacterium]|nr:hypothetical protein [Porphyromonadaceae bacterium]
MKGIIFTKENFLLTIKGLKTQTRRIIPEKVIEKFYNYDDRVSSVGKPDGIACIRLYEEDFLPQFSRYKVGEIVYLKEPYQHAIVHEMVGYGYFYGCDKIEDYSCDLSWFREMSRDGSSEWQERWNKYEDEKMNKLFMPEIAARYFIKITGVKAERLQDISEEDCLLEGIKIGRCGNESKWMKAFYAPDDNQPYITAKSAYEEVFNRINGKGAWRINPFVWVYDYELTKQF